MESILDLIPYEVIQPLSPGKPPDVPSQALWLRNLEEYSRTHIDANFLATTCDLSHLLPYIFKGLL